MNQERDRLVELLAERALVGLTPREQIELAELLVKAQDVDIGAFDSAASAIALAAIGKLEPIPAALARSIEERAMKATEARPASDFANTRQLDKLSPSLAQTQVDDILNHVPEPSPPSVPAEVAKPFTKTQTMDDRPELSAPAPPNDAPYLRTISTEPRPFAPTSASVPSAPPVPSAQMPMSIPHAVSASVPASMPVSSGSGRPVASSGPLASYGAPLAPPSSNVVPFRPSAQPAPVARGPSRVIAIGGWVAAAACLLLAIGAFALRSAPGPIATLPVPTVPSTAPSATPTPPTVVASIPTPAALREQLLAAEGTTRAEWASTKDPAGKSTTGEVVWNKDQQKGVMRFRGLAKNDPTRAQYQLWIFDKTRDEKYPVDGGVFDVDSETGDVLVAIHAAVAVSAPSLFAVTLERPGGVVVSKRERLVVTAKPAG